MMGKAVSSVGRQPHFLAIPLTEQANDARGGNQLYRTLPSAHRQRHA